MSYLGCVTTPLTAPGMARPLSSYDYRGFLADPDTLTVPVNFVTKALPTIEEPTAMPAVSVPAPHDSEGMVQVAHRRIRVLEPYFHLGWEAARPGAFVRSGVAERLAAVADSLPAGFGLAILDAWRPLELQAEIFEAAYADTSLPA